MDSNRFALTVLRHRFLGGPNIWTYRSAMEVWLDLGALEQRPSHTIEGLTERLLVLLPGLAAHHCGVGEPGGFLQRLREGTWAGHVLEHCVIELLNLSGMPTGFGQTRSTSQPGVYRMVFRARNRATAEAALSHGHALLQAAMNNEAFDVAAAVKALHDVVDATWLGPSTAAIVNAATERGIPHLRLTDGNLVQLGQGARQRRIWTAETELTSAIAENIAGDKDLTKSLLLSCGVPVPEGHIVANAQEAWDVAQDIGLPVVVKPSDANHGRGVSLELSEQADIERAFAIADAEGSDVIVERYILGNEHRVLVVGGRVVAANRGESLWVTGDGVADVKTLIDLQLNSDPRRGEAEEFPLETIRLEREPAMALLLERQGLGADAVPAVDQRVLVQRNGNMAYDCTDEVHPEVAYMASLAARAVGLDIAGIDMVTQDIGRPLHEVGGAIVEVNAGPGLLMHLRPAIGQPRPVGEAIVAQLFDPATPMAGRVPLIGVSGTRGTALLARAAAFLLDLAGAPAGLASSEGIHIGRRRIERAGADYWEQCQRLLMNREIQGLAVETAPSLILDHGLPYDRCLVGVVTDLGGWEGLTHHDIFDASGMPRVLRTQVDVVLEQGACVLNLDEPGVADLARHCDGSSLGYGAGPVPADVTMPRTVRWQGEAVCLIDSGEVIARAPLTGIADPATAHILCGAAAAAWAAGMSPVLVAAGLQRFDTLPRA
ncbi:cyanophycin synthetase family protein [Hydrogenophaga sp.]|uniref:cyanophycin synthetase family protein n=1 Tax=Hydrogenophaga sp. TaxID=1904254 RepID=UPI002FC6C9C7